MTSPNGSKITRGFLHLEDSEGAVWTMDDDTIFRRNGKNSGGYGTAIEIWDGKAYCSNGSFHYVWEGGENGHWVEFKGVFPPVPNPDGLTHLIDFAYVLDQHPMSNWNVKLYVTSVVGPAPVFGPGRGYGFIWLWPDGTTSSAGLIDKLLPRGANQVTLEYREFHDATATQPGENILLGRVTKTVTIP